MSRTEQPPANALMRCVDCGKEGWVQPHKVAGRTHFYKGVELEIPYSLEIPTCEYCGAEWLDEATTEALEQELMLAYLRYVDNLQTLTRTT